MKYLSLLFFLLIWACVAPPGGPTAQIRQWASSSGDTLVVSSLFDEKNHTGWKLDAPWGVGELLRLSLDTVAIDTLQLVWAAGNSWGEVTQVQLYTNGQSMGYFPANSLIPIRQKVHSLWLKITEVAGGYELCAEGENLCLQKNDSRKPYLLAELRAWQGSKRVKWQASENATQTMLFEASKMAETWVEAPIGNNSDKATHGISLHPNGSFVWYEGEKTVFGAWTSLGNQKQSVQLALRGFQPTNEGLMPWQDTLLINDLAIEGKNIAAIARELPDSAFVNIKYLGDFAFDMRYATANNFMKQKVYDCDECWLRYEAAKGLAKAQKQLEAKGCRLKLFDCYRPLHIQKKLWEVYPNPTYVANPYEGIGSIHNRGGAVDITIVNAQGEELDMGTPFDFFGRAAHQDFFELPDTVLANRQLLREAMQTAGFLPIRTEWWHYSYQNKTKFTVSDKAVMCD